MKQPLLFRHSISGTTTRGRTLFGYDNASSATHAYAAGVAGTISDIAITSDADPGSGVTVAYTLQIRGSDVVTLNFTDGNLSQTAAGPYSIADGDEVRWLVTITGGTAASMIFTGSAIWEGTNAQEGWIGGSNAAISGSATRYHTAFGSISPEATEGNVTMVVPMNMTITRLYSRCTTSPTPGTMTTALVLNGTVQDGAGGTPDTRMTHSATGLLSVTGLSLAVNAGDTLSWQHVPASSPGANTRIPTGIAFTPAVDGESVQAMISGIAIGQSLTYWPTGIWTSVPTATYANATMIYRSTPSWVAKKLYALTQTSVGASPRTRVISVDQNNGTISVQATIPSSGTTGNDTSNTATISTSDQIAIKSDVTSTPSNTRAAFSFVSYIAPTTGARPVLVGGRLVGKGLLRRGLVG